jgi:hypothetical protein
LTKGNGKTVKVKFVISIMITIIFVLNFSPNTSYACSCVESGTVKEEWTRSSAVFSGKVIDIVDKKKNSLIQSSADLIAVLIEVEESWKGNRQNQVVVYTERSSASCGFEFTINNKYLVYANENDGKLKVSLCSRTTLLSLANEDIDELGEGEKPTEQVSIDMTTEITANIYIYISLFIVFLLLGGLYMKRRIKK